jgi:hypothetical protein
MLEPSPALPLGVERGEKRGRGRGGEEEEEKKRRRRKEEKGEGPKKGTLPWAQSCNSHRILKFIEASNILEVGAYVSELASKVLCRGNMQHWLAGTQ